MGLVREDECDAGEAGDSHRVPLNMQGSLVLSWRLAQAWQSPGNAASKRWPLWQELRLPLWGAGLQES